MADLGFNALASDAVSAAPVGGSAAPPGEAPSQPPMWPDHVHNRRKQSGQMEVFQSLLLTTLAAALVPRAPLYTQLERRQDGEAFNPPNITVLLTPAAPATPVVQPFDWPTPERKRERDVHGFIALPVPQEAAPAVTPVGGAFDWPTPERLDTLEAHYLIVTRYVQEQRPFTQHDWPTPEPKLERDVHGIQLIVRPPVGELPQIQTSDWPNPLRAPERDVHGIQRTLMPEPVAAPLLPVDLTIEFRKSDYDTFQPPNLLTTTLFVPVVMPFNQTDWPNPVPWEPREHGFAFNCQLPLEPVTPPVVTPEPPRGGDDKPDSKKPRRHPGYSHERYLLKISEERKLELEIRELYRRLHGFEPLRARAEAIVEEVAPPPAPELQARDDRFHVEHLQLARLSRDNEIALRLLALEQAEMLERDDEAAIMWLLAQL